MRLLPDGTWLAFLFTWGYIIFISTVARIDIIYVFKRSLIAIPFALAAITVLFNLQGEILFSFQFIGRTLQITDSGVIRFISILLRSWLSVQAAILLVSTTQFPDLVHALRHLRVPRVLLTIISFMYRYMYVLSDEVIRMLRARDSRSAWIPGKKGGGTLFWRTRTAGNMAGQLFLRCYERSDRVYHAMLSRGYRGELLTINPHTMKDRDWNYLLIAITCILTIQFTGQILQSFR
jgi:cobalt/nickel transport system permease protein